MLTWALGYSWHLSGLSNAASLTFLHRPDPQLMIFLFFFSFFTFSLSQVIILITTAIIKPSFKEYFLHTRFYNMYFKQINLAHTVTPTRYTLLSPLYR